MKILVASGKGGVGKSMIAASLAVLISKSKKVLACDCDVESPNLGIWLGEKRRKKIKDLFVSEKARVVDQKGLDDKVIELCKFGAIEKVGKKFRVNKFLCEGCGLCALKYPKNFEMVKTKTAEVYVSETSYNFPLIHAQIVPGEASSGRVVDEIKALLNDFDYDVAVLDSAAGIGCPVIASIKDVDFVIVVVEPTKASVVDMKRMIKVVEHFRKPYRIVLNKSSMNEAFSNKLRRMYSKLLIGEIDYDVSIVRCLNQMKPPLFCSEKVKNQLELIYQKLKELLVI